ncbi:MAG: putative baseplate assembly protein [Chloroflexi bacterium]|nr:putative baseplate assembly protein [Chloroflexota bacterium]OJV92843.1 MAG: putative baseplate assembly protein [Chloroflexi bacterium 54-19]
MPIVSPNLDDRDFQQLLDEARRQIVQACPDWNDLSPSDPGMILLELFAHLTETMIYRLNRLPQKVYIELLRLIGVQLQPPASARTELVFSRAKPGDTILEIPRGTRVSVNRSGVGTEPPVFITSQAVTLGASQTEGRVLAFHADQVEGELMGLSTGVAGQSFTVKRPPIIAPTGDDLDLIVAVETPVKELGNRAPAIQFGGKSFRIWREVTNFSYPGPDAFVFQVDRLAGTIVFAPATRLNTPGAGLADAPQALAEIPPANREIRVTYRRGGGQEGNLPANSLNVLKDAIAGVLVTNPRPATGGRAAETLENALVRGPQQLHSLERAVTARDFELVARNSSVAVARAKAITQAALWRYARPGTVGVLLVPYLPETEKVNGQVTAEKLRDYETNEALVQIQQALDERRPLGTTCLVSWAHYKAVSVNARVVVRREEDPAAIRQRVIDRLNQTISPLPSSLNPNGWPFGETLRSSNVYDNALAEPGVRWVDRVSLVVDEVPDKNVTTLSADPVQPRTWYAGSGELLFRSLNDGEGWETTRRFPGEQIYLVKPDPDQAGLLAVLTNQSGQPGSRLYISHDNGETWDDIPINTAFRIYDLGWAARDTYPLLLLAADGGLYELSLKPGGTPVQLQVDDKNPNQGFYAVAVSTDVRGAVSVAVAAQKLGGIYLSSQGGRTRTFRLINLQGEDIRELAVMYNGPQAFLWAAAAAPGGDDPGHGCFRWQLRGDEDPPDGWQNFSKGWNGGTCYSIAFQNNRVLASSHKSGVLRLDLNNTGAGWQTPDVRCGLPLRDQGRFHTVQTAAADPQGRLLLAGGVEGVFASDDNGISYDFTSKREFTDKVTLPETWLFVSKEHNITVVSEDEAN